MLQSGPLPDVTYKRGHILRHRQEDTADKYQWASRGRKNIYCFIERISRHRTILYALLVKLLVKLISDREKGGPAHINDTMTDFYFSMKQDGEVKVAPTVTLGVPAISY